MNSGSQHSASGLSVCRLSVIIPARNARAWAERAVESVLSQPDPIGTEVVVMDDASRDGTADHLEAVFGASVVARRLQVHRPERSGDRGRMRNQGAAVARGSFLAFLNPEDRFSAIRLAELEPSLSKHDLIVGTRQPLGETSDWIRAFLTVNWTVPSSIVVRRSLFDAVGGFAEGYGGHGLPVRVPGEAEYEFVLKALIELAKRDERARFLAQSSPGVILEPLPRPFDRVREAISLARVARGLPRRYWPSLGRRVADDGRGLLKRLPGASGKKSR